MTIHEKYINRCIELAKNGAGSVSPNPMVGCVIVHKEKIIGEGYHKKYGEAHAEVNAVNSVQNKKLLKESTIYVSLEPCAHFGLTPPCSDLIIENRIPEVVIGIVDPFAQVAGRGIEKLKKAGIRVITGVLENKCRELNKRFFTYHEYKRPFIILKWAQTTDGFIDIERKEKDFGEPTWITGKEALKRVHEIRAVEDSILVGTNTAIKDNPSLTVRHCEGRNPLRIVLDNKLRLPGNLNLFDQSTTTIVFNSVKNEEIKNIKFIKIDFSSDLVLQILKELYKLNVLSLIVEGGKQLLDTFIKSGLWDEAHIFTGDKNFEKGISAPLIKGSKKTEEILGADKLTILTNEQV